LGGSPQGFNAGGGLPGFGGDFNAQPGGLPGFGAAAVRPGASTTASTFSVFEAPGDLPDFGDAPAGGFAFTPGSLPPLGGTAPPNALPDFGGFPAAAPFSPPREPATPPQRAPAPAPVPAPAPAPEVAPKPPQITRTPRQSSVPPAPAGPFEPIKGAPLVSAAVPPDFTLPAVGEPDNARFEAEILQQYDPDALLAKLS
jgi:hypothetical protein